MDQRAPHHNCSEEAGSSNDIYVEETLALSGDLNVDSSQPPYQCPICKKVFAVPARLQRHHRVHTGEKPFKCEFCDKTFSVKENLNVHRRIHTKERPYQCCICSRAFEHSGKLHRHMRTHTGERPHKCELCGKTFVQSGQLVIHMRAHTGEKPYTCDYCQKGFTCSKQLKVHIRTHTGEKPYKCDICNKTFGYNHVLKMHKMSHLGEKLYKCTLCEEFFNSRKALDKHIKEHSNGSCNDFQNGSVSTAPIKPGMSSGSVSNLETFTSPRYNRPRDFSPLSVPLTPPQSPDSAESHPTARSVSSEIDQSMLGCQERPFHNKSIESLMPYMAFFTTNTGEKLACPAELLLRLQDPICETNSTKLQREVQEKLRMQQEMQARFRMEDERKQTEKEFFETVHKVLESLFGKEMMVYRGNPDESIDTILKETLKQIKTEPCWEPSLQPMDRIKVNLRLLLERCAPNKSLWKEKSIQDIVLEILQQS